MQPHSSLFESLFKRGIASPGNTELLEQVTNEFPFFIPAQFYLLKQTESGTTAYSQRAEKATVLFNNRLWLNFQLQQFSPESIIQAKSEPVLEKEEVVYPHYEEQNNGMPEQEHTEAQTSTDIIFQPEENNKELIFLRFQLL